MCQNLLVSELLNSGPLDSPMCWLVSSTTATNNMSVSDKTLETEPVKNILGIGGCFYCRTDEKYLCSFQFIYWQVPNSLFKLYVKLLDLSIQLYQQTVVIVI